MAQKSDIQYVQFYTDGSAARQAATRLPRKKKPVAQPHPNRQKRIIIQVDPVAVCGIFVAGVMLVLMAVGIFQLRVAEQRQLEMERYISTLEEQNAQLRTEYAAGYDLEAVREAAQALGMVPVEQLPQTPIQVTVPQTAEEEPSLWKRVSAFFADLFA